MLPSSKNTQILDQESLLEREFADKEAPDALCIENDALDVSADDESHHDDEESKASGEDDFREKSVRILKRNQDKTLKKERKQLAKQDRQEKLKTKIKKAVKKRKQKLSMEKRKK